MGSAARLWGATAMASTPPKVPVGDIALALLSGESLTLPLFEGILAQGLSTQKWGKNRQVEL